MSFWEVARSTVITGAHVVATSATIAADVATNHFQELSRSNPDLNPIQARASHAVQAVASGTQRAAHTASASFLVLLSVVSNPAQSKRLIELIQTHDFTALIRALRSRAPLEPDFFPTWIRRAGGYFPKFAQVLSVRADLIHNQEVLQQLSQCLEDMPARSTEEVCAHLERLTRWDRDVCQSVGRVINAGTVAQVNELPNAGGPAVVKVAWEDRREQMRVDFKLFSHARAILKALDLADNQSQTILAMFSAVSRSEGSVLQEFDLRREAVALREVGMLTSSTGEWLQVHPLWLQSTSYAVLNSLPAELHLHASLIMAQVQAARIVVNVPQPLPGLESEWALAMQRAGGTSALKLLQGDMGQAQQAEMYIVFTAVALPFVGWLLLCKSSDYLAHVDPHPGNFRWDSDSKTLWVLDWGSSIQLQPTRRRSLCLLVTLLAAGEKDVGAIADAARAFGIEATQDRQLAQLLEGIFNVTPVGSAREALSAAAVDQFLENVADEVVPVVRCLALLGGMLKEAHLRLRGAMPHPVHISLAALWAHLASVGLNT